MPIGAGTAKHIGSSDLRNPGATHFKGVRIRRLRYRGPKWHSVFEQQWFENTITLMGHDAGRGDGGRVRCPVEDE